MARAHSWQHGLRHQKTGFQIGRDYFIPIALTYFLDLLRPGNSRIVHKNVDRAQPFLAFPHQSLHIGSRRNIRLNTEAAPFHLSYLQLDGLCVRGTAQKVDGNSRAHLGESDRYRATNPPARTRNQRHFSLDVVHGPKNTHS